MFEAFKKTAQGQKSIHRISKNIFFTINVAEERAFLEAYDELGLPIDEQTTIVNPHQRYLAKRLQAIVAKETFTISWDETDEEQRVYLDDHPDLMEYLKKCPEVTSQNGERLKFADEQESVTIQIHSDSQKKNILKTTMSLSSGKPISAYITDRYVLSENTIYEISPLGNDYRQIKEFITTFPLTFLPKYLSLLVSHIDAVQIQYDGYQIIFGEILSAQPVLLIDEIGKDNTLHLRLSFHVADTDSEFFTMYDITKLAVLNDKEKQITIHDINQQHVALANYALLRTLAKYQKDLKKKDGFFEDANGITLSEDLAKVIMEKELGSILQTFEVLGTKNLKKYKIHASLPRLDISLTEGINFLEGNASLEIANETFGLFDALTLYKTHSYIPLSNGDKAVVNPEYIKKLSRIFQKQKNGNARVSFFDLPLIDSIIEDAAKKDWPRSRKLFDGFNTLEKKDLKHPPLGVKLRDYQHNGVKWMKYLYDNSLSGCLADDMGLGKTIQAITLLSHIYPQAKDPTLIVVPKSLLFNWQRELTKINPSLSTYTYYQETRDLPEAVKHQIILTTYHTLRGDIKKIREITFDTIILDESGNIKNPESQIAKAVALLTSKHRFALSGTPIENNLNELFALFRFLEPAMFRSHNDFLLHYLYPIQKEGNAEALEELKKKLYPFILRRTKRQVLTDLPDKIENTVLVELEPEFAALYEKRRKYYYDLIKNQVKQEGIQKSQFVIFQAFSELRQLVSCPEEKTDGIMTSPKRAIIKEQLEEALANNHKILVFTQYLNALETIANDVREMGVSAVTLSGATSDREKVVDKFVNDPSCRVFIATMKTGGFGLNLTVADTVFIYDPWWNKAAENQAIDRTHRMGQKNTVFAYKLIAKGTIEEKMLQLQEKKAKLFSDLIPSDTSVIKSLTEADIDFMLR